MKIIILTVDHLYANLVLKELVRSFKKDINRVIVSGVILHNHSFLASVKKYLVVSGVYYFLAQTIKLEVYKLLSAIIKSRESKFYSFKNLLNIEKIPFNKEANVNNKIFLKQVMKIKPDLIVSVFFNQILSSKLIKLSKKGVINIHPAYLPDYKGVSPVFWALVNGERFGGVSVHYINEGIDTGSIIVRKKISIEKNDSEHSLYLRSAKTGSGLLIKAINDIKRGRAKKINNLGGRYYSLPAKKTIDKFKKRGRYFFNLKEYIFN